MGRSLAKNEIGLFPQVYTTPVTTTMFQSSSKNTQSSVAPSSAGPSSISTATTTPIAAQTSSTYTPDPPRPSSPADSHISSSDIDEPHDQTEPLAVEKVATGSNTPTASTPGGRLIPAAINTEDKQIYPQGVRSPVVEDTLSDIDEAITEISNSRQRRASRISNRRHTSMQSTVPTRALSPAEEVIEDSSSEYSRQDNIESNSNSEFEDDEEEDEAGDHVYRNEDLTNHEYIYSEAEIGTWTPYQVSQYLQSRNIPSATCQKFEEEEVTGTTLLQLEMSHLKELEIGSFGKRFEVWKEIENLVKKAKTVVPAVVRRSGSDARMSTSSYNSKESARQRSSTVTGGTVLPRIQNVNVLGHGPLHTPMTATNSTTPSAPPPYAGVFEAPRSPPISPQRNADTAGHYRRSSGNRRLSSQELPATALNAALSASAAVLTAGGNDGVSHQRGGSFDRNWSIPSFGGGLKSSGGTKAPENGHKSSNSIGTGDSVLTADSGFSGSQTHAPKVTERSYFSSGESTPRERKVLQKKNGGNHARKGSSVETSRKPSPIVTAAQAYHARGSSKDKKRMSSFSGAPEGFPYDAPRLSPSPSNKIISPPKRNADESTIGFALSPSTPPPLPNSRSLSEQLTPQGESGGRSFNSLDGSTPSISATIASDPLRIVTPGTPEKPPKVSSSAGRRIRGVSSGTALRTKSKKHSTSAWEKGLREVTPREAAETADYSGWMKKRGSSGIGVWKSRFFVLQGRRLSYFYSERDTKERGLIDITSHRVLPATEDRLVSLHASFAAATSPSASPAIPASGSPQTSTTDTGAQKSPTSPSSKEKGKEVEKDKGWFTFKLVPPAPGATKGVTFTPPKLHYFATDTRDDGKKWMGAIMKATIDRDESKPVISSYNAKTISLAKARELRARPPDLLKEGEEDQDSLSDLLSAGLAISGVDLGVAAGQEAQEAEEAEEADVEDERDEVLEGTESGLGKVDSISSSAPSRETGDPTEGDVQGEKNTSNPSKSNGVAATTDLSIVA
ncbi:hypothetical protein P167DRAFT_81399 [Morchella conica CCBAS932]|uniref:PH domain-containing protein n=1 Tax=Morchella conica CCBAS932 TaxID=1392247 RepID=A0A3N4KUG6_9PEZI|nr:hypothetical protein P167DRAFT_81399 [Morchella conica CCBAS932]